MCHLDYGRQGLGYMGHVSKQVCLYMFALDERFDTPSLVTRRYTLAYISMVRKEINGVCRFRDRDHLSQHIPRA